MEKDCFSCQHGYNYLFGMSQCCIESPDSNYHYDNFCCRNYDPVSLEIYKERVAKKREDE